MITNHTKKDGTLSTTIPTILLLLRRIVNHISSLPAVVACCFSACSNFSLEIPQPNKFRSFQIERGTILTIMMITMNSIIMLNVNITINNTISNRPRGFIRRGYWTPTSKVTRKMTKRGHYTLKIKVPIFLAWKDDFCEVGHTATAYS